MKKTQLLIALLAFAPCIVYSQWSTNGSNVYLSSGFDYVGIGIQTSCCNNKFEVAGGVLFQSTAGGRVRFENPNGDEGLSIHNSANNVRGDIRLNSATGLNIGCHSSGSAVYDPNLFHITKGGLFGIGVLPTTHKFEVLGNTKITGTTYVSGQVGINRSAPTCALDVYDGNGIIQNIMKLRGGTYEALVDIQSTNSGTIPASPLKTGLFVNRTDVSDINTSGAEIHGQTFGIRTSAIVTSGSNTIGINSQSVTPDGSSTGVYSTGAGTTQSCGVHAVGSGQFSTNSYGVYGYAWSGVAAPNAVYGIYGDINPVMWPVPNCYAGFFNGNVYANGNVSGVAFIPVSDRKLKKNIEPMKNSLDIVKKLNPTTYTFRTDEYGFMNLPNNKQYGFIAQEVEKILPEAVIEQVINDGKDGKFDYKGVNYTAIIPILTSAIQEQQSQIEAQQKQIEELKDAIAKAGNNGTGTDNYSDGAAKGYLSQNTPNPFTQNTSISYKLPASTQTAAIGVYDLSGREVKLIPLGTATEGNVTIEADSLRAGMYVYSLIINGEPFETKKMILTAN